MSESSSHSRKADQAHQSDRLSATLRFDAPVSIVPQVSPQRAAALKARGIDRVRDLLNRFPNRYLDMSQIVTIASAPIGFACTVVGRIHECKTKKARQRLSILEVTVVDGTSTLIVTCFNQPWLAQKLKAGDTVSVSGKIEFNYGFKRMTNPFIAVLEQTDEAHGFVQAYHGTINQISPALVKRMITNALKAVSGMYDPLPLSLRKKYRLCSRFQAYRGIHLPRSMEDVAMARRRLLYEELLFLELQLVEEERKRAEQDQPFEQPCSQALKDSIAQVIPFELTDEQRAAVGDILGDMAAPRSMDRMLLGDVGTGKTIVSLFALATAVKNGHQAVMVGPTEILVRQYGRALGPLLDALGISWAVLAGTTPDHEQAAIQDGLASGQLSVCFGTHALFEPAIQFASCSFVCFDEQQRFGVDQRERLLSKAPGADVLSMTATPIPRSLALALYGTTALSYLHVAPHRKATRTTKVLPFTEEAIAYDAVRSALARGEQAYVVCPLIGIPTQNLESEDKKDEEQIEYAFVEFSLESDSFAAEETITTNKPSMVSAAEQHAQILQNQVFPDAKVALLHGRLPAEEKTAIMEAFVAGQIDILVSTTIVEVGVDVPNATVMIIEDADRFGLAQLHQLRGRVGRGEKPGEVFLITRSKAPAALERLRAMETTEDGFQLSEMDLAQRKEGDVFGARQHGRSPLRLVNVIRDSAVIEAAYNDARDIVLNGSLTQTERAILDRELLMVEQD
ncbi:ATP-dependent DNA helicase RecG [Anaerotardibacter muris]|uniref:ATP-dependent DNA helicase RecG n=1 Tax=Anaerotardibacter muris TaxID=2941505 RepID=UPI00203B7093|nr:ATP-dependent DNA helicase RecG [Anaerotardibacter muris]